MLPLRNCSIHNVLTQQEGYDRNTDVPFYAGVLVKSGGIIQSDAFMKDMITKNRLNRFKGECFFFMKAY